MKKDSFKKKLAAYAAMTSAILAARPYDADAQIQYTDVNGDCYIHDHFFNLDLNNDGVVDFQLTDNWNTQQLVSCLNGNEVIVPGVSSGSDLVHKLNSGDTVGPAQNWGNHSILHSRYIISSTSSGSILSFSSTGEFFGNDLFLGLRMTDTTGNVLYGWARLDINYSHIVLKDYAVNEFPDSSIVTGGNNGCQPDAVTVTPNFSGGQIMVCAGDSLLITVHGAFGSSFKWYYSEQLITGENDSMHYALQNGIYWVMVTGQTCSIFFDGIGVTNPFNDNGVNAYPFDAYCDQANGKAVAQITYNGNCLSNDYSQAYDYLWSNGETTQIIDSLSPGFYTVTVTDCSGQLRIDACEILSSGTFVNPAISQNGNVLSTGTYLSYKWYLNGVIIPGAHSSNYTPLVSGYYQVWGNDGWGCEALSDSFYFDNTSVSAIGLPLFRIEIKNKKLLFHFPDNSLLGHQIEIINDLGQLVTTVSIDNQTPTADLSSLPSGIYFYHIRTREKTYSGKFLIAD